ncbi:MAG: hypothetical protein H7X74_01910 [Methyloceanibacter sp.]|nr:hypothetical protein [Methyloceanibacter sp.]
MLRKSLIVTLGFLGLFLAGTAAGTAPASAGYSCGPWNNWCRSVCGPWNGWCANFFVSPGYSWHGGHGKHRYSNQHWNNNNWNGKKAYKGGKGKNHAHSNNWKKYR